MLGIVPSRRCVGRFGEEATSLIKELGRSSCVEVDIRQRGDVESHERGAVESHAKFAGVCDASGRVGIGGSPEAVGGA